MQGVGGLACIDTPCIWRSLKLVQLVDQAGNELLAQVDVLYWVGSILCAHSMVGEIVTGQQNAKILMFYWTSQMKYGLSACLEFST